MIPAVHCAMQKQPIPAIKQSSASNRVRIIGGTLRSRVLRFPPALGLRPTGDRVRETLFNWLGQTLYGKNCLDLFAGSGALGFEAASRGAKHVVINELNAPVYAALEANRAALDVPNCTLCRGDAQTRLKTLAGGTTKFDVVFIDPPFASTLLEPTLAALPAVLAPYAQVYVEWATALPDTLVGAAAQWQIEKSGRAGIVHFALLSLK